MDKRLERAADQVMFSLWDLTTGQGGTPRACYKSAACFGRFVLSQIAERQRLEEAGETHIESRALVIPTSILKAWTWNVLEDCHDSRCTPPYVLLQAIYYFMGCNHLTNAKRKSHRFDRVDVFRGSLREAANRLGVAPTTIRAWRQQRDEDIDYDLVRELRERTNFDSYLPMRYQLLRTPR